MKKWLASSEKAERMTEMRILLKKKAINGEVH